MATDPSATSAPIRVAIQQPALPKYRIPVFRELSRRPGLDVRIVYAEQGNFNVQPEGLNAQCVPMHTRIIAGQPIHWNAAQWNLATRAACDVLILSWDLHYASLIPSLLRAKANGVATILWGHGYSKNEAAWRSLPRRKVTALADALLFYNHTAANRYIAAGTDPARVFVALNALDQTPIQKARHAWQNRPEEVAAAWHAGGEEPHPRILFVSRLDPDNRLDLLLQAAARLLPRYPRLQVVIVGKGPDEARLRQLAAELNVGAAVRFTGPIYEEEKLAPFFVGADMFCYPANIGLSILHAFGYGLPVITGDRIESQNPEIEALRDEKNGLLFKHGHVEPLCRAIVRISEEKGLREVMSHEALRTVTERFTLGNMVDQFEAAARYCVARKP